MGPTESGKEVVQRNLVPYIVNGELKGGADMFLMEKVIGTQPQIKQMPWGQAGGIVIVVRGPGHWNIQPCGPIIPGVALG